MTKGLVRVLLLGCGLLAVQPIIRHVPLIGWFLTIWPVTWGVWIYLASCMARELSDRKSEAENARIPAMVWSALVGGVTGLSGAVSTVLLNTILATVATAAGPEYALATAGFGLNAGMGLFALVTRPFWGILVCGAAGLLLGGHRETRHRTEPGPGM